jgi:hypothetical protein
MQTSKPTKKIVPIKTRKQVATEDMALSKMVGSSKRLTLTYIVLGIWVALAVFAILMDGDLYALAVYFASGLPLILGYLWSETSRPSIRDAAEIVKGIGMRPGNNYMNGYSGYGSSYGGYGGYNGYNSYGGNNYNGNFDTNNQSQDININLDNNLENNFDNNFNNKISIYSDDASIELKINQQQLSTLKNMGYVDMIGNKYTFKKGLVDQIKSLISDNSPDPII